MSLDLAKLRKVRPSPDGWQAQCPACALNGSDKQGVHLKLWRNGKYSCAVHPGDESHNKAIYSLAGSGAMVDVTAIAAEPQVEVPEFWDAEVLEGLKKDHSYWKGRGIDEEVVAPFRGGVAERAQMAGRYVFPVFDDKDEDKVIGFAGRRLDSKSEMKWKILGKRSLFIWGGIEEIESSRRVILVESIGDTLALMQRGVKDVLCLFGTSMSQAVLAKLIMLNPSSIIISLNRDDGKMINGLVHYPGQEAAVKIERTLLSFFGDEIVRVVLTPEGVNDWGCATTEQIAATFDKGA